MCGGCPSVPRCLLGFGCRGVSGAVARAHGPCFEMEIEKWLGEEFEDGVIVVKLPTSYALALQMAVASAAIKPQDVPGAVVLDDAQLLYVTALLQSVVDDVLVGTAAKDAGLRIGAADRMRFKKWMELRYSSEEDVMLETPSKALAGQGWHRQRPRARVPQVERRCRRRARGAGRRRRSRAHARLTSSRRPSASAAGSLETSRGEARASVRL